MSGKSVKELVSEQQLKLFLDKIDDDYSNSVELYDALPKYVHGRNAIIREQDLPAENHVIERQFTHPIKIDGRNVKQACYLRLSPATIIRKKAGKKERFYAYPSYREMLVEDAVRKLAIDVEGNATLKDGVVGCRFTVRQIRRILADAGHQMKHEEVTEAINVLNKCHMEYGFIEDDGKTRVSGKSALFPEVYVRTADDVGGDDTLSAVMFHELVNRSIRNRAFRSYDFSKCIKYKSGVTNYLHKRLSMRFIQAAKDNSYRMGLMEFVQSCGVNETMPLKEQVRTVKEALDELKRNDVVSSYLATPVPDPYDRRKRLDMVFDIQVTDDFVQKTIRINSFSKRLGEEEKANG